MNHKTYLMKEVSGFWNQVPLGSFYLCENLGVGSILARKNINWKVLKVLMSLDGAFSL